ncbi:D-glycero-alpha-D-manno-heptose 1-phosphate guanylyltransferase [Trichlorobacter thiogenes]|uniref:D-glycero-alpha-D-manno-heptose 1-phosphate guanylyltransferase n=1 Tax=Trichlorobacter thiogenes TaxID=115783 RepID=A0A1T4JWN7_9BACT|nr:nucleotidyltransferase family protein [Trichlorobacter thiogenes]SJZ34581.1 D-glycero-alpha-D-manno-heptose 1-phosphate guanylyltransferase [Trichlorobacter thiogenes]
MKAIILAGGLGTRLQGVVKDLPKPMAPINGRPFLEILVNKLKQSSITDIVLAVGYRRECIQDYFGNGANWGVTINYSIEATQLGTGGAIKLAMERFYAERYLIMNGDSFFENDLPELVLYHQAKKALITMALAEVSDTDRYGAVKLDADGMITHFTEKGVTGRGAVNAGVYVLERETMNFFSKDACSFETDVLQGMVGLRLFGLKQHGFFTDIGIPEDYHVFCQYRQR